jgi:hypothetical protein
MNRNNVPLVVVACAIILALAGLVIVIKLKDNSTSSTPTAQTTVTVTATASPTQTSTPVSTPTVVPTSQPASSAPLTDFTVCTTPSVGCNGEMRTQPSQIIVSGDGSAFVSGLTWTGWGSEGATGSGTLKLDNCQPNCAQGKFTPYVATITLSDLTSYGSAGLQGYADMTVSAPGSQYGTQSYSGLLP